LASSIDPVHQPTRGRPEQRRRLADLFALLTNRMRALRDPHEWSEIELTMPQFRALDLLVRGPQRMGDIAGVLGTSLQATTSLIDRLTDKGLVERQHDTTDRRVVTCQITATGRTEIERIYRLGQSRTDLLVEVLTDDELGRVVDAFAILADAALRLQPVTGDARLLETAPLGASPSTSTSTTKREQYSRCPR
jgi:DNA-binding MarR family transcriptional regulator